MYLMFSNLPTIFLFLKGVSIYDPHTHMALILYFSMVSRSWAASSFPMYNPCMTIFISGDFDENPNIDIYSLSNFINNT